MVFTIIVVPFWSAITEAYNKKEIYWIKNSVTKLIYVWLGTVLVTAIMLFFSKRVYEIWVGTEIVIPFKMSFVMALFVIINNWNNIFAQFLYGVSKLRLQLYSSFFVITLNNIKSIILLYSTIDIYTDVDNKKHSLATFFA